MHEFHSLWLQTCLVAIMIVAYNYPPFLKHPFIFGKIPYKLVLELLDCGFGDFCRVKIRYAKLLVSDGRTYNKLVARE